MGNGWRDARRRPGRVAAAIGVVAVLTVSLLAWPGARSALAAVDNGTIQIQPGEGNSETTFQLAFTEPPSCAGDTASGGYQWATFVVPDDVDVSSLSFSVYGTSIIPGRFTTALRTAAEGAVVTMRSTAPASTPGGRGEITDLPTFSFDAFADGQLNDGHYLAGVACTRNGGSVVDSYWTSPLTIITTLGGGPDRVSWSVERREIPLAISVIPGAGSVTVHFSAGQMSPEATSYTLSATPVSGGTTVSVSGASSPLTLTGLANGVSYRLRFTGTNDAGTSAPRFHVTSPVAPPGPPPTDVRLHTEGPCDAPTRHELTWTAPPVAPSGYLLTTGDGWASTSVETVLPGDITSFVVPPELVGGTNHVVSLIALYDDLSPSAFVAPGLSPCLDLEPIVRPGVHWVELLWFAPCSPWPYVEVVIPTSVTVAVRDRSTGALAGGTPVTVAMGASCRLYETRVELVPGVAYDLEVTGAFAAPKAPPSPWVTTLALPASSVVVQDIDVTRPAGALVLTQVCGAHGALPGEGPQVGFPDGLAAVPGSDSSTVVAPTQGGASPVIGGRSGPPDPRRPSYPYPTTSDGLADAAYPTRCGVELATADYVTRGPGAGQFFATQGRLDQVTVVDTRDQDPGWNVVGSVSDFEAGPGRSFSGSQLGWTPVRTEDTPSFFDSSYLYYDQVTAAGPPVAPNTSATTGLSREHTLLSSPGLRVDVFGDSTGGLGVAIADARLKLLIPVTAKSGTYEATLTLSVF